MALAAEPAQAQKDTPPRAPEPPGDRSHVQEPEKPATRPAAFTYEQEAEAIRLLGTLSASSTHQEVALVALKLGRLLGDCQSSRNWYRVADAYRLDPSLRTCFVGIADGKVRNPAAVVMDRIKKRGGLPEPTDEKAARLQRWNRQAGREAKARRSRS
jgi:hypothetical protein